MLSKEKTTTVAAINSSETVDTTLTQYLDTWNTLYTNNTGGNANVTVILTGFGKQTLNDNSSEVVLQYRKGTSGAGTILDEPTWKKSNNTIMPYNGNNSDTTRDKDAVFRENNLANGEVMQFFSGIWRAYYYKRKLVTIISYAYNIPASSNIIKGLPRELKIIGKKASATLFGVHTDNTRVTQD